MMNVPRDKSGPQCFKPSRVVSSSAERRKCADALAIHPSELCAP
jgi:hypothetical protein